MGTVSHLQRNDAFPQQPCGVQLGFCTNAPKAMIRLAEVVWSIFGVEFRFNEQFRELASSTCSGNPLFRIGCIQDK